jgi:predicted transcriptional regulator
MKDKTTESLNDIFEVEGELVQPESKSPSLRRQNFDAKTKHDDDITKDYTYARENMYDVIERGTEALDYLLELAKASEHPRAFEVVSTLSKTIVDANKDLLEVQTKLKKLQQEDKQENPQNVTNALFVGSTADLQKLIKGDDV